MKGHQLTNSENYTVIVPINQSIRSPYTPVISIIPPDGDGLYLDDCREDKTGDLTLYPPPTIHDIMPPAMCNGTMHTLVISGEFLLTTWQGATQLKPSISVNSMSVQPSVLDNCISVLVPQYDDAQSCTQMDMVIDSTRSGFAALNNVSLVNPPPADCLTLKPGEFRLVPPPHIEAAEPPIICVYEGDVSVTLLGTGFLVVDGMDPLVELEGPPTTNITVLGPPQGCTRLPMKNHTLDSCTNLTVLIPRTDHSDIRHVSVRLTLPLLSDCSAASSTVLTLMPPPGLSLRHQAPCDL